MGKYWTGRLADLAARARRPAIMAAALAAAAFGTAATGQDMDGPPCQEVTGQVVVDGFLQQVTGVACLQPDGTWQMVDASGGMVSYAEPPYYVDPWYWAPFGVAVGGVILIDRFHHIHRVNHVFLHAPGMRFHGGMGGFRGAPGGVHGGGFHGGGHR